MVNSFKPELNVLRDKYRLFAFRDCTKEETAEIEKYIEDHNRIPDNVMIEERFGESVYCCQTDELDYTHEERIEYIMLKQAEHLSAIRKMLLFFVVLTCISLAAGLIAVLAMQSA